MGNSGHTRQVDILIEGTVAGTTIRVAVECKDWSRRVGIDTVEQFLGKLADIDADRGIMYSSSGYSQPAHDRCDRVPNKPSVTLRAALIDPWTEFDYLGFISNTCVAHDCCDGTHCWSQADAHKLPIGASSFVPLICSYCGVAAVRCSECASINSFVEDTARCNRCDASWLLQYRTKYTDLQIRQFSTSRGHLL